MSQATAKASWTLKGQFVEGEFFGEMMGRPFTGRSLLGYDNTKTSMFTSEGERDGGYKVIENARTMEITYTRKQAWRGRSEAQRFERSLCFVFAK